MLYKRKMDSTSNSKGNAPDSISRYYPRDYFEKEETEGKKQREDMVKNKTDQVNYLNKVNRMNNITIWSHHTKWTSSRKLI